MAHRSQIEYVRLLSEELPHDFNDSRVLEVGSLDLNGSIRSLFPGCEYVGIDVAEGPGVDVVCEGQNYDGPADSFDTVISCEAMEHNPHWEGTFRNMIRLCKPGGLVVMTCASTGRPEHGTARSEPSASPLTVKLGWNYYRNLTEKDFRRAIDLSHSFAAHRFWVNWNHYDLLFAGIKGDDLPPGERALAWNSAARAVDAWLNRESSSRVHRYRRAIASVLGDRWFAAMHRLQDVLSWLHRPR
jgi:SAM-dependent methyltransferase